MMHISFLLKQLCCCHLDIRFFSLTLIGVSFCNLFQLHVLFLTVHRYTENCFTTTECCFKSTYYQELHSCVPPNIKHRSNLIVFFFFSFFAINVYLSHWKLLIKHAILEIDLISLGAIGDQKKNSAVNGIILFM